MKTKKMFATTKLFLAVLTFATLTSGMAAAQSVVAGKFKLDETISWNKAVLAPGSYTLTIDSAQMPTRGIVRSDDGKIAAVVSTTVLDDQTSQKAFIKVTGAGSQRRVQSLNLPTLGVSLVYDRPTKAEQELAKTEHAISTIAVVTR